MAKALPQAVNDCRACLLWFLPHMDGWPKTRRFTLAKRIEDALLDSLALLYKATYQKNNSATLSQANSALGLCQQLWRLAYELRLHSPKQYKHGSKLLTELGKQVGGWQQYAATSA